MAYAFQMLVQGGEAYRQCNANNSHWVKQMPCVQPVGCWQTVKATCLVHSFLWDGSPPTTWSPFHLIPNTSSHSCPRITHEPYLLLCILNPMPPFPCQRHWPCFYFGPRRADIRPSLALPDCHGLVCSVVFAAGRCILG